MERKNVNSKKQNLYTIDEANENSLLQSALPKDSANKYTSNSYVPNKENLEFTKLPKFLTSTINTDKEQTNLMNKNILFTPNYKKYESSVKPELYNNNSNLFTSELFSKRKAYTNKLNRVLLTNFTHYSIQKILNELKKFGDIKDYYFIENNNILVVEYENYINAIEAVKNFDVRLLDKNKPITIEIIGEDENVLNMNRLDNLERRERRKLNEINKIPSPNVSYYNHIIDFLLNW